MQLNLSNPAYCPEFSSGDELLENEYAVTMFTTPAAKDVDQPLQLSRAVHSPASLMARLMEKAHSLLSTAANSLHAGEEESFQNATLHASQIILSLRCLLDTGSNKKLSKEMFLTYTMIATGLRKAREDKDLEAIKTINRALVELRTAWRSVE